MSGHRKLSESAATLLDELLCLTCIDTCKGNASQARAAREKRIIAELLRRAGETVPPEQVEEIFHGTYRAEQEKRSKPQQTVQP